MARRLGSTRAPRYAIRVPLRYRHAGESDWIEGTTENISRSGVLFRGGTALEEHTQVEMSILLPRIVLLETAGEVLCSGVVVRGNPSVPVFDGALMAVSFTGYSLNRRDDTKP